MSARVRLGLAYDGTNFSGWAIQPGLRTVQGVLEAALETLFQRLGPAPKLTVAGRTDAGVHALGQVAHLDLTPEQLQLVLASERADRAASNPAMALRRRMSGLLGATADVAVTSAEFVSDDFDARFSAEWRRYQYRIADQLSTPNPLRRFDTSAVPTTLDVAAMQAAADTVLGLHDFATFCKARPEATTIRTLQAFNWHRDDTGVLIATIQADAFCHSMVRALVGGCVAVGQARFTAEHLAELRAAARRTGEFVVMPANGLTLVAVGYPPPQEWAERADRIRAKRTMESPQNE